MLRLEWSASHAVFVAEMDDEHVEIFQSLSALQTSLATEAPPSTILKHCLALATQVEGHFAHEERLMRAARYDSFRWHKRSHDHARRRVGQFISRLEEGESDAGPTLVEYLISWLRDHTRLADMMLGAFLRNHRRSLYKVSFRAGTKPIDACEWVNSKGEKFDPASSSRGY
ncbi:MAG: hemerythrin family protein [Bryobacteraceae bacterium]|jgi:hemerythrin